MKDPLGLPSWNCQSLDDEKPDIWCIEIAYEGRETWVLPVTSTPSSPDQWCRVGMGIILREANENYWFQDMITTRITLV
jgi:hypothetical protein